MMLTDGQVVTATAMGTDHTTDLMMLKQERTYSAMFSCSMYHIFISSVHIHMPSCTYARVLRYMTTTDSTTL
jgi:hypothetical protein